MFARLSLLLLTVCRIVIELVFVGVIKVIMVIVMVLCLGIRFQGIKISESYQVVKFDSLVLGTWAERDLKGLKAKIRGLDLSLNAISIKYFLYLYLNVYRAASHLSISFQCSELTLKFWPYSL